MRLERIGTLPVSTSIAPVFSSEGDAVVVAAPGHLVRFVRDGNGWRDTVLHERAARSLAAANGALVSLGGSGVDSTLVQHDPVTLEPIARARRYGVHVGIGAGFVALAGGDSIEAVALETFAQIETTEAPPTKYVADEVDLTGLAVDPHGDLVVTADDGGTKEDGVGRTTPVDGPRILFHHIGLCGVATALRAEDSVSAIAFDPRRARVLAGDKALCVFDHEGRRTASAALRADHIAVSAEAIVAKAGKTLWLLEPESLEPVTVVDLPPAPAVSASWLAASDSGIVATPNGPEIALWMIRTASTAS